MDTIRLPINFSEKSIRSSRTAVKVGWPDAYDKPYAVRYGFVGRFRVQRIAFEVPKNVYDQKSSFLK
ncbi:MAG: hypothetical protein ACKO4M_09015, partial [Betaproteobacteria bacterium]